LYGIIDQEERFGKRLASENTSNYKVVLRGDLVYDPMLLWDASIGFVNKYDEGLVSPAYATFSFKGDKTDREFLESSFDGHYMRHMYKIISQGTNTRRRKAPADDFLEIPIKLPPKAERQKIAAVLNTADQEVVQLKDQLAALRRQKQGLMQVLLTGRVRVKV
jgi:type I restriction enzyme S subunit